MSLLIGYDLCDDYSQISIAATEDRNVISLPVVMGAEKYCIPTCMVKRRNVNQWLFGDEAIKNADEGFLVEKLFSRACGGETILIENEEFEPVSLLSLFLKHTMRKLTHSFDWNDVRYILITVDDLNTRAVDVLREATEGWDMKDSEVRFISHSESFFYYTMNQPEELRLHKVELLDYDGDRLKSSMLSTNSHMRPHVTMIEERTFDLPEKNDAGLLEICREIMDSEAISSVYLSGEGFEGDWDRETVRYLCMQRRVFQGRNLYTKGVCYAALDLYDGGALSGSDIYLDKDKLKSNIGINLISGGAEKYFTITDAGVNWFDVSSHMEVMLGKDKEIRIVVTPITGNNVRCVVLRADDIPDRPDRACRVKLDFTMKSVDILNCSITDLGFGEIFPATGNVMNEEINISDREGGRAV